MSAWHQQAGDSYERYTIKNAKEARRWHVVSNQMGMVGHGKNYSHSRIVHPKGEIIFDTGEQEGMVIAEIDLHACRD